MKKKYEAQLFDDYISMSINRCGDDDDRRKIDYVKNFINKNFHVEELDNSYVEIGRVHSKSLMWLLVSLLIDYEFMKRNQKEQIPALHEPCDKTLHEMKMTGQEPEKRKNYLRLEIDDLFQIEYMTLGEVGFIKNYLEKINVDLETEDDDEFILNGRQFLFLLIGIMKEYNVFLTNGRKIEK